MVLESDPNPDRTQEDESMEATHMISISEVDSFVNQVEAGLDMSDKESSTQVAMACPLEIAWNKVTLHMI